MKLPLEKPMFVESRLAMEDNINERATDHIGKNVSKEPED
jgi:hypothetical protein